LDIRVIVSGKEKEEDAESLMLTLLSSVMSTIDLLLAPADKPYDSSTLVLVLVFVPQHQLHFLNPPD
jgi:hypothetical protein